jgi:hypothetical protein
MGIPAYMVEQVIMFSMDATEKKAKVTAKKIPAKGKRYSRSFPFDRNFAGPVSRPFSSKLVVWAFGSTITVTETRGFVQHSVNVLT